MSVQSPIIVWFRQDLRLADNPALAAAHQTGAPILPVYILDDVTPGAWAMGGASRWWLHHSLASLDDRLRSKAMQRATGEASTLVFRRGEAMRVLQQLIKETGARAVHWNRCYEPHAVMRDARIKGELRRRGVGAQSFNASLLFEPWSIKTGLGEPFRVFTPFYRACLKSEIAQPVVGPDRLCLAPAGTVANEPLEALNLLPKVDWSSGLRQTWRPGEPWAQARLADFVEEALKGYKENRDRPDRRGTSRLSPHLHFGEIGPRQVWHRIVSAGLFEAPGGEAFARELIWREFSYQLLFHNPNLPDEPLRPEFAHFPWQGDAAALRAWHRGQTGYPIVDAGMRELWETGWMHNHVRMIVASFLTKHLLQPWQAGARWFWDTLVDADLANNSVSWQWVAGCGADAAPYFRIFNPMLQSSRFDPQGSYIRRWLPELARLPADAIHGPWLAEPDTLSKAGVVLEGDYPLPIIDHASARKRSMTAFQSLTDEGIKVT